MTQVTVKQKRARRLTPWFSSAIAPVRAGVYLTRMSTGVEYWRGWDGKSWHYASTRQLAGAARTRSPDYLYAVSHPALDQAFATSPATQFLWCGVQGDEHSVQRGESLYEIEFGDEPRGLHG